MQSPYNFKSELIESNIAIPNDKKTKPSKLKKKKRKKSAVHDNLDFHKTYVSNFPYLRQWMGQILET